MKGKFVTCLGCQHVMTWLEHSSLICALPCPSCGARDQFGPGVYVPEFKGYSWADVVKQRADRARMRGGLA